MLALWHALVLNRSADTQQQAVQFFLSAALIGRVRSASTPPLDRAIRQGIQSAVHRMLGQARQTRDLALRALPVLDEHRGGSGAPIAAGRDPDDGDQPERDLPVLCRRAHCRA